MKQKILSARKARLRSAYNVPVSIGFQMKGRIIVWGVVIALICISCEATGQTASFQNPVYDKDFPDPTVVRGHDGWFYAYATNSGGSKEFYNMQVARSKDLVTWELRGDALPQKPSWANKDFWAPHVLHDAEKQMYYMYYSGESADESSGKCIGVATATDPEGPFKDKGEPLICGDSFVNIDPMAFDDPVTGKKLLYWGSAFLPIKVQELTGDRLSFEAGSKARDIVVPGKDADYSKLIEGAWLHQRNGYYYLFYSGDNCCGDKANYAVMIARAENAEGPFERMGETLPGKSSAILVKNDHWLAPGHNSVITDDNGQDWIFYHAIERGPENKHTGRIMLADRITYENGWPQIGNGTPTVTPQLKPVVKN